ncbi:hypothetical protein PRVXT_001746 [Proteinivorax tanatarense]|uniref:Uncharacterized protein n=1 Tax=Proteinivorax tanatarense TaxID=1260629 RepID=A0AAU7VIC8_9FIRM
MSRKISFMIIYFAFLYVVFNLTHAGLEEVYGEQPEILRIKREDKQIEFLGKKLRYPLLNRNFED